jgi:hypothetical protein
MKTVCLKAELYTVDIYGHWMPGEDRNYFDEAFLLNENPKETIAPSGPSRT